MLLALGALTYASCARMGRLPSLATRRADVRCLHPQPQRTREETSAWSRVNGFNGPFDGRSAHEPSDEEPEGDTVGEGAVALGALASSALVSEAIQVVGTGLLIYAAKEFTQADDLTSAVHFMASFFQGLGPAGYVLYAGIMVFLQVIPVASAFVLTISAGVVFGSTVAGTALVSAASTTSAALAFVIARFILRDKVLELAAENKTVRALDKALENADLGTSMLVIVLLRSSPLLPYSWASYLFGVCPVVGGVDRTR